MTRPDIEGILARQAQPITMARSPTDVRIIGELLAYALALEAELAALRAGRVDAPAEAALLADLTALREAARAWERAWMDNLGDGTLDAAEDALRAALAR